MMLCSRFDREAFPYVAYQGTAHSVLARATQNQPFFFFLSGSGGADFAAAGAARDAAACFD
jgi:hypothetical protein